VRSLKIIVGFESSGVVRTALRRLGHDAISVDFLPTELPGPHIQDDVYNHVRGDWDMGIFFPTCTFMCNSSQKHLYEGMKANEAKDNFCPERWAKMEKSALEFRLLDEELEYPRAIENPIMHGHAKSIIGRKQDQVIHPYNFGHRQMKSTCLWLTDLDPLEWTTPWLKPPTDPEEKKRWEDNWRASQRADRWRDRSRTFDGIGDAMAMQWAGWATGVQASMIRAAQAMLEVTSAYRMAA
jgi:hypothetical protein